MTATSVPRRICSRPFSLPRGEIVEVREAKESRAELEQRASAVTSRPGRFLTALQQIDRVNVIAECKRRSPSRGVLRDCMRAGGHRQRIRRGRERRRFRSLTEPAFFDGALEHLQSVRAVVDIPVLRKDFIVSEYQLLGVESGRSRRGAVDRRRAQAGRIESAARSCDRARARRARRGPRRHRAAIALDAGRADRRRQQPQSADARKSAPPPRKR